MEFTFETNYNTKSMSIMAKALRKTIRRTYSRRSHVFGWIVTALGLLFVINRFAFDMRTLITALAILIILMVLIFEDKLNAYMAKKRLLPGTEKSVSVFSENHFTSTTDIGKSEWNYDKIMIIAETTDFFVFIFSMSHAQLYDKQSLTGGTIEDFRDFIENVTGKQVQAIK